MPSSDIEIARAAKIRPIAEIAQRLGIPGQATVPYGHTKCKITLDYINSLADRPDGKLILVTGITPTPPGEGKTTTTVGLGDGLNRIGKNAAICVREPSLGPSFGMKGGAAGGGYAQVIPMEDINLHFTGDFHAITTANNLLAALIDNHIKWENTLHIDPRRVRWRRVMDMNDRALRNIVTGLGPANGMVREAGFDITAASEVMAIFCLATDLGDLQRRIGDIIVAETYDGQLVTASDLGAAGAMTVLLRDALMPNMVQTLENNPAFIHGGPFANIAHGCNSAIATRTALKLCDYVVTEAGFGADLGAEKFFDIKCRKTGLTPDGAVVVATVRALKMHGGVKLDELKTEDVDAVRRGCANLARHIRNVQSFGVPVVVAINEFATDTEAELSVIREAALAQGVEVAVCTHYTDGGAGAEDLAKKVVALTEADHNNAFKLLYDDDMPLWDKVKTIATKLYAAKEIIADKKVRQQFAQFQRNGHGHLPVCMAKTQYSFSTDPKLRNAPSGHVLQIREIRLSAGAGFVVVICGSMMTMPGLPRSPSASDIGIDENGNVFGLS